MALASWIGLRRWEFTAWVPAIHRSRIIGWLILYTGFGSLTLWRWTQPFTELPMVIRILQAVLELLILVRWLGWMIPTSSPFLRGMIIGLGILPYLLGWLIEPDAMRSALQFQWMQVCFIVGTLRFCRSQNATRSVMQIRHLLSNDWYFGAFLLGISIQSLCNTLIIFAIPSLLASLCTWIIIAGCFSFSLVPIALAKATLCYPKPHSNFC